MRGLLFSTTALLIVFGLFAVRPLSGAQSMPTPIGKLVDVGGYRVHLYCTGTGSPPVIIVGAGFSFDWGLVQTEVAKHTQVCSYDHSGVVWSDSGPKDSCSLRVGEVHAALKSTGVSGPYVIVGHSLGGLVARLFAGKYPDQVAGVIFVDHAFSVKPRAPFSGNVAPQSPRPLQLGGADPGSFESDPNFTKLSARDRQLHLWAMSQTRNQLALQTNAEIMPACVAEADAIVKGRNYPLGDKPLVDVSRGVARSPTYIDFQNQLLSLSQNSKEIIAENSGHFVIIDRPDVVIDAVIEVVRSVRNHTKLEHTSSSIQ
jgi:pimeloyl-ACP methyl ester carboxylesterase